MTTPLTVECNLPLASPGPSGRTRRKGRQPEHNATRANVGPNAVSPARKGKIPRVVRLMALAIHFDELLHQGLARDQTDLARLGQVTVARMSQIMSLLNLSPAIQEAILFLPAVTSGRPDLILADLLPIAREWDWGRQGERWDKQMAGPDRQEGKGHIPPARTFVRGCTPDGQSQHGRRVIKRR